MNIQRRKLIVAVALVLLVAGAAPARAFDADYLLGQISDFLQAIADVKMAAQDALQGDIRHLWKDIFGPGTSEGLDGIYGVFQDIKLIGRGFRSIRDEVAKMSCDWQFSARTLTLRGGLFAPVHFCRPTFRAVFGAADGFWDSDLEEMHDAVGAFTYNTISDNIDAEHETLTRIFPHIEDMTKHVLKSPGWANREEAVALGGADLVAAEQGRLRTTRFLREATDAEYERFLERKESDFAMTLLLGLKGESLPDAKN